MLKVVTPAADLSLISIEVMRTAAGVAASDISRDDELERLALRVSAEIASACRIAAGQGGEPTLRQETLEETFRSPCTSSIILARRHQAEIVEIALNGEVLVADGYWVDPESGILRMNSYGVWRAAALVITYKAGFENVPADLAGTAEDLARYRLSEAARDPLVRGQSSEVPGVLTERTDYWVGAVPGGKTGSLPSHISSQLRRYKNVAFV